MKACASQSCADEKGYTYMAEVGFFYFFYFWKAFERAWSLRSNGWKGASWMNFTGFW